MGLFDNLFKKVGGILKKYDSNLKDESENSQNLVQEQPKESFQPFKNKAEKQYYEMAYGLLSSSNKERSSDDIRRFVGFHTSRETDFSVSSAARRFLNEGSILRTSLFKNNNELTSALTTKGISADEIEQIIELNKTLDESFAYRYLPEDADTICNPNNYDCDFYKKTLVFKKSRDSIVPLTAERAAALKAAEAEKAAAEKAAAEKVAAAKKAAAEKEAAKKAAAEKAAAEKAAAEKVAAAEKAAAEKEAIKPFSSIEAKQYYEMAYGLLSSTSEERSADDVRRFVEFHTSRVEVVDMFNSVRPSDAAKKFLKEGILARLSLFKNNVELSKELTAKGISDDEIEHIIKLNKELDESLAYRYSPEDVDTICDPKNYDYGYDTRMNRTIVCKISKESIVPLNAEKSAVEKATALKTAAKKAAEEKKKPTLQEIEKDCKEVFDNCSSYEPGSLIEELHECLERKKSVYVNNLLRNTRETGFVDELEAEFEAENEAEILFCEVLYDNYFDKLRCVLVDTFNKILSDKRDLRCKLYGSDKYMIIAAKQAAAITIRALNYEKHGQNKDKYPVITEDSCREFVSNREIFKTETENNVADDVLEEISGDLCGGGTWYLHYELKDYHMDAVCHAFWKSVVAKLHESDSADSNYIFNMFLEYFKPNQDKLDHLAVEHHQYMELEARKKAVRHQCDGCARCDYCVERYKREICSAWIPKQR